METVGEGGDKIDATRSFGGINGGLFLGVFGGEIKSFLLFYI